MLALDFKNASMQGRGIPELQTRTRPTISVHLIIINGQNGGTKIILQCYPDGIDYNYRRQVLERLSLSCVKLVAAKHIANYV